MEEKNEIIIGNFTTIITSISLAFAGLIIGLLASYGLKLPIDQQGLAGVIGLVLMFCFSIINTRFKSTYFTGDTLNIDVTGLTENQIQAIQNFVDNCVNDKTVELAGRTFNKYNDAQIEDVDPASDYEDGGC